MALVTEVADRVYEIKPEGKGLDCFPLCTVYLVVDDKTALIEAGCPVQAPEILNAVEKLGYDAKELSYIIPTHVHGDHAGGAGVLAQWMPQAHVVAQPHAANILADPSMTGRLTQAFKHIFGDDAEERFGMMPSIPQEKFILVKDGESIPLGGRELKVIHTPGHDPGAICLYQPDLKVLVTGDLIFKEGIGRTDLPGGNSGQIKESIRRMAGLDVEWILPGHGNIVAGESEVKRTFDQIENFWFAHI